MSEHEPTRRGFMAAVGAVALGAPLVKLDAASQSVPATVDYLFVTENGECTVTLPADRCDKEFFVCHDGPVAFDVDGQSFVLNLRRDMGPVRIGKTVHSIKFPKGFQGAELTMEVSS